MATVAANPKKIKKVRIVKGIEHGLSGYTNYKCRCDVCREANTEHTRDYRRRRFAGNPLCIVPRCDEHQSQAYGNGLCHGHALRVIRIRKKDPKRAARILNKLGVG